jgi:hypothetical protein
MPKYVKAKPGPNNSVVYTDAEGNDWIFEGGNRPWRNQNPGDLVPGNISKRNGAIGSAGGFAVFPDYQAGHSALMDSLKSTYGNRDIRALMEAYAPKKENDTEAYIKFVQKKTGMVLSIVIILKAMGGSQKSKGFHLLNKGKLMLLWRFPLMATIS